MEGYYSREHYQCNKIWVKNTISIKIAMKHKYITMLEISKADAIVVTAHNLAKVIQGEMTRNIGENNTQHAVHAPLILLFPCMACGAF